MPPPWMGWAMGKAGSNGKLNTFDVTNLVVGSIIGADVYVATGVSLRLVGPFSLVIWLIAGIMAVVIALSFAYCVMHSISRPSLVMLRFDEATLSLSRLVSSVIVTSTMGMSSG